MDGLQHVCFVNQAAIARVQTSLRGNYLTRAGLLAALCDIIIVVFVTQFAQFLALRFNICTEVLLNSGWDFIQLYERRVQRTMLY